MYTLFFSRDEVIRLNGLGRFFVELLEFLSNSELLRCEKVMKPMDTRFVHPRLLWSANAKIRDKTKEGSKSRSFAKCARNRIQIQTDKYIIADTGERSRGASAVRMLIISSAILNYF